MGEAVDAGERAGPGADVDADVVLADVVLAYDGPLDGPGLLGFLGQRAVPGVEDGGPASYRRTLRLRGGAASVVLSPAPGHIRCQLRLEGGTLAASAAADAADAAARCRRLLDLDADVARIDAALSQDPLLAPAVAAGPGRRVPGTVDATELAVRAVLGQQVSVAGARTLAGRLVARHGTRLAEPRGPLTHLFPTAAAVAEADDEALAMPESRRRAVRALARAIDSGALCLDPTVARSEVEARLLALPGIGPWTASYIAMRALGDGDAFLPTDLGVRRAFERAGLAADPRAVTARAERWRPYRAYAVQHLWA